MKTIYKIMMAAIFLNGCINAFAQSGGNVASTVAGETDTKRQELYNNEYEVVKKLRGDISKMASTCYDYAIEVDKPLQGKKECSDLNDKWLIKSYISIVANKNMRTVQKLLQKTLKEISMSVSELNEYEDRKEKYFLIKIEKYAPSDDIENTSFYIRNEKSYAEIVEVAKILEAMKYRCVIDNGLHKKYLYSYTNGNKNHSCKIVLSTDIVPTLKGSDNSEFFVVETKNTHRKQGDTYHLDSNYGGDCYQYNRLFNPPFNLYKPVVILDMPNGYIDRILDGSPLVGWNSIVFYFQSDIATTIQYTDAMLFSDLEKIKKSKVSSFTIEE